MSTSSSYNSHNKQLEESGGQSTGTFRETSTSGRKFYGHAEHRSTGGVFSSLLKRKVKKVILPPDVKSICQQLEDYKSCSDRIHSAMMFLLVENTAFSLKLDTIEVPATIDLERSYLVAAEYIEKFEVLQKKGKKSMPYDNLEPVITSLKKLGSEYERYVRKQIEHVKPLAKFIGEDYWEYARLRKIHWEAMETYDMALTAHNKERTDETEKDTINAQNVRNDCKTKLLEFINKINTEEKPKHAECIIKFGREAGIWHNAMSELIVGCEETAPVRSAMAKVKPKVSGPSTKGAPLDKSQQAPV